MMPSRLLLLASSALLVACSSPSGIVEEAINAADLGDREAYIACFTERSRPILRAFYNSADAHNPQLGALGQRGAKVAEVNALNEGASVAHKVHVVVVEDSERVDLILRQEGGAWRIDLLDSERFLTSSEYRF